MSANTENAVQGTTSRPVLMVLVWLWVLIPFCYGLYQLLIKIPALFGG